MFTKALTYWHKLFTYWLTKSEKYGKMSWTVFAQKNSKNHLKIPAKAHQMLSRNVCPTELGSTEGVTEKKGRLQTC